MKKILFMLVAFLAVIFVPEVAFAEEGIRQSVFDALMGSLGTEGIIGAIATLLTAVMGWLKVKKWLATRIGQIIVLTSDALTEAAELIEELVEVTEDEKITKEELKKIQSKGRAFAKYIPRIIALIKGGKPEDVKKE